MLSDIIAIDLGSNNMSISTHIKDFFSNIPIHFNIVNNKITLNTDAYKQYSDTILTNYKFLLNINYDDIPSITYESSSNLSQFIAYTTHKNYTIEKIYQVLIETSKSIINNIESVSEIIFTVSVNLNLKYRRILYDSALHLGFSNISFINITNACAYAYYGLYRKIITNHNILVIDLGAIEFNASIINNNNNELTVRASYGDLSSGYKINWCIIKYIIDTINSQSNKNIELNNELIYNLFLLADDAKKILNTTEVTVIKDINNILKQQSDQSSIHIELTREVFNNLCSDIYKKIITVLDNLLHTAKLNKEEIDDIILVGGNSNIIKFKQIISGYFNKDLFLSMTKHDILKGALLYKQNNLFKLHDITNFIIGIKSTQPNNNIINTIIPKYTQIPYTIDYIFNDKIDSSIKIIESYTENIEDSIVVDTIDITPYTKYGSIVQTPNNISNLIISFMIDSNCILHFSDTKTYENLLILKLNDIKNRVKTLNNKNLVLDKILDINLWMQYNINITSQEYITQITNIESCYINNIENSSSEENITVETPSKYNNIPIINTENNLVNLFKCNLNVSDIQNDCQLSDSSDIDINLKE